MARSSTPRLLMILGLGVGGAWLGAFGADAQRKVREIARGLGVATGTNSPFYPGGGGGGSDPSTYNPNFWQQAAEWKAASGSRDWARFRQHVVAIGAPDPGANPPAGW